MKIHHGFFDDHPPSPYKSEHIIISDIMVAISYVGMEVIDGKGRKDIETKVKANKMDIYGKP